jgi:hypothetical protein
VAMRERIGSERINTELSVSVSTLAAAAAAGGGRLRYLYRLGVGEILIVPLDYLPSLLCALSRCTVGVAAGSCSLLDFVSNCRQADNLIFVRRAPSEGCITIRV